MTQIHPNEYENRNITGVVLPSTITTLGREAFRGSAIESINLEATQAER